jgi:predicted acylesterase/phospholipase RssA
MTRAREHGRPADADLLRHVPLLAGLSEELRARVAADARLVRVAADEYLFRQGEEAEDAYVVSSGRLVVLGDGDPPQVIRTVRRGAVLGELALLSGGTRSASVVARRVSELVAIGRTQFGELLSDDPGFAIALARMLGAQLATHRAPVTGGETRDVVAVVAMEEDAPAAQVADWLEEALTAHGSVAVLDPGDWTPAEHVGRLAQAEREHDHVLLRPGRATPDDPWTAACLSDGDCVLAVSAGRPDRSWTASRGLTGCDVLVRARGRSPLGIGDHGARDVQIVTDEAALLNAVQVTARRIAGRAVGIVFSGGGARAFAHLGVAEELATAGVRIDRIGGVSFGAVVGGALAMGGSAADVAAIFEELFERTNPTNDWTVPAYSLVRGAKTRRLLAEYFGDLRFEDLPLRFFCASADLNGRRLVIHRSGPLRDAVYASVALPGIYPPLPTPDGRLLVDGGVLDNLPVFAMAEGAEGPVIASDVTGSMGHPRRRRSTALGVRLRRVLSGQDAELPRLADTMLRTLTAGSIDTVVAARRHADLLIAPPVDGIGLLDFKQVGRAREAGRAAVRETLAADPRALDPFRS